jgi:hypothetical protein
MWTGKASTYVVQVPPSVTQPEYSGSPPPRSGLRGSCDTDCFDRVSASICSRLVEFTVQRPSVS